MEAFPQTKILIFEDEMIIATDISMQLTKLGYEIIGIQTKAEGLLETIADNRPDIILMDIVLGGKIDGIDAALLILENDPIPVVFLTSNTDDATFQRALAAKPFAFVAKPFRVSEIRRTLELIENRNLSQQTTEIDTEANPQEVEEKSTDHVSSMKDRLFIRHKNQLVKVFLSDILYIEADRIYCKIITIQQPFVVSIPLRTMESQLPGDQFLRVHRSFVINLNKIDAVDENFDSLMIGSMEIPISRRMKEEVGRRLNMI